MPKSINWSDDLGTSRAGMSPYRVKYSRALLRDKPVSLALHVYMSCHLRNEQISDPSQHDPEGMRIGLLIGRPKKSKIK